MRFFSFICSVLIVLAVGSVCAALPSGSGDTFRYKMTVTVTTPEGDKTGSAVREVSVTHGLHLTPEMQPAVHLKGEAVVVDLGSRGVLFALLNGYYLGSDYGSDLPGYIFHPEGGW